MEIIQNLNGFSSFDESLDPYKNLPPELRPIGNYSSHGNSLPQYYSSFHKHTMNWQKVILSNPSKVSSFTEGSFDFKSLFSDFIDTRLKYLDGLKNLGDNWISGKSKQPSIEPIDSSKQLLENLRNWISAEKCVITIPPKVIMGPTPTGGISIELNFSDTLSFSINILDDNRIELEKQENGHYSEIKVAAETVLDEIISRSKAYVTSI